tara:strand:+ start:2749 stop:4602 length:1854 start_codon:yes stop_codon:yes gene_type:complete
MVKLIRLNTSNSDAHFKASFDTDITINENSKIALKNLTFESDFARYEPSSITGRIGFKGNGLISNDFFEQAVEPKIYTRTNLEDFENEVNQAFNRTISLQDGKTNSRGHIEVYGEIRLLKNNQDKYELRYIQSQAIPPSIPVGFEAFVASPFVVGIAPNDKIYNNYNYDDEYCLISGTAPVADERYCFTTPNGLGLSKGAGVFYCRIKSSAVNGTNATHNGFSIGLSFGNPRSADTTSGIGGIDDKVRNCEIIYQDPNTNYFVRQSDKGVASTSTDTGVSPHLVNGGALNAHDIIMFKIDNNPDNVKIISAHIYTSAGGSTENVIFSKALTNDEINGVIKPYIYFRGADTQIILDMVRFSPDPFYETEGKAVLSVVDMVNFNGKSNHDNVAVAQQDVTHEFLSFGETAPTQAMRTTIAIYYPTNFGNSVVSPALVIPAFAIAGDLAEILGFNKLGDKSELNGTNLVPNADGSNSNGLRYLNFVYDDRYNLDEGGKRGYANTTWVIEARVESLFDRQDSYIVESMTLPLLSYNSAIDRENTTPRRAIQTMGSRKNILATIPQHTDSGLCQYEPNEIVYIDIKNDSKLNIRNLELRVLDNNFQPIRIVGEADMTLLIDN